jgi:hypothetical protein
MLYCISSASLNAQVLRDTATLGMIKKCVDCTYNFQLGEARILYNKISQKYPGHPVLNLLNAMRVYWESFPLVTSSQTRGAFEKDLRTCIDLCEKKRNNPDEAEFLLINLCARGMLLLFYADNDLSMEVIPLASSTYQYIRRAFDYPDIYPDFAFFTGLYNYYREAYPEAHPVYKALAFMFPKGNKAKGLKELQKAAKISIVLKAESSSFLSGIFISFENDYDSATLYSRSLHELYPDNLQYLTDYIKNLLLVKKYDEAEKLIISADNAINNPFCKAELDVYKGIIQEKKYKNPEKAKKYYFDGAMEISLFGDYGNDIKSFAYFGLSRLSDDKSEKHLKRTYRKKAMDLSSFKKINFDD